MRNHAKMFIVSLHSERRELMAAEPHWHWFGSFAYLLSASIRVPLAIAAEQRRAEGSVDGVSGLAGLGCVANDHDLLVRSGELLQVRSGAAPSPIIELVSQAP
jgi:hypothetical protein